MVASLMAAKSLTRAVSIQARIVKLKSQPAGAVALYRQWKSMSSQEVIQGGTNGGKSSGKIF